MDGFISTLEDYCFNNFPDLDFSASPLLLASPVQAPVQICISGFEMKGVFAIAEKVKNKLMQTQGLTKIRDDWGTRTKKLLVNINQPRA